MSIKEEFGYGGMMHNFKNYMLLVPKNLLHSTLIVFCKKINHRPPKYLLLKLSVTLLYPAAYAHSYMPFAHAEIELR